MVAQGPLEALVMVRVHAGQPIFFLSLISSFFMALERGYVFSQPKLFKACLGKPV